MDGQTCGGTCGTLESLHKLARKKVHLVSYGCTYNLATTLRLRDVLLAQGCIIVPETNADVVIVNTCTVVGRTEQHILARLRSITAKELIVIGCMVRTQMDRICEVCSPRTLSDHRINAWSPLPGHHDGRCDWGGTDC